MGSHTDTWTSESRSFRMSDRLRGRAFVTLAPKLTSACYFFCFEPFKRLEAECFGTRSNTRVGPGMYLLATAAGGPATFADIARARWTHLRTAGHTHGCIRVGSHKRFEKFNRRPDGSHRFHGGWFCFRNRCVEIRRADVILIFARLRCI
jgi:hypothetical protein